MELFLVLQLFIGGLIVLYMDEVISKWGFGSGVSLFIAAGVSSEIVVRALSPLTTAGTFAFGSGQPPVGAILVLITSLIGGDPRGAMLAFAAIAATAIVFVLAVYTQAMKIEIPLSFGRIRGYGIRWPMKFMYTSNIPVILVAALLANIQLWARLLEQWGHPLLGTFSQNTPTTGIIAWLNPPDLIREILTGSIRILDIGHASVYMLFMMGGAILFSIFWVQTSGQDAATQAKQIMASGLQIPGFRRDERVIESILSRYIMPLTVMGAVAVGFLSGVADLTGALSRGTGLLLTVMIIYQLYESIAKEHMMDMHPSMKKMMGG